MANIVELRDMSNEKLEEMLENGREEMFNLRFQHAGARVTDTNRIRIVRRELAQVKSVMHNRSVAIETAASHADIAKALDGKEWDATAKYVYEDSGWNVVFSADNSDVATALVNLNTKKPKTRRDRISKTIRERVVSFDLK